MSATKVMLLGILIMLLGLALNSAAAQFLEVRAIGFDGATNLAYGADTLYVIGFLVGVAGLFFKK